MDVVAILVDGLRQAIVPITAGYALVAMGLNFHFGYTGLLNFGQAGFMLVGAYGMAITSSTSANYGFGQPWWVGVIVGILAAVVLALILGIPTLRLRADYLAITTIASAEMLRIGFRSGFAEPLTGGVFGIQQYSEGFYSLNPIPAGSYLGPLGFTSRALFMAIVGWGLVALFALITVLLVRSPWGRVVKSIREDEDAARSLGKNAYWYKMQALIMGGVMGAIGGMVIAMANANIGVDGFRPDVTFYAYAILILGGAARVFGPIVGAPLFWGLVAMSETFLRQAVSSGWIPTYIIDPSQTSVIRFVLVGGLLMVLMAFRPQGIFGDRREMMLGAR